MRVSILTYDDPFATIVLDGLFSDPDIEIASIYLSKDQFYGKTRFQMVRKVIKKSGLRYFLLKAIEFYLTKFAFPIKTPKFKKVNYKTCRDVNGLAFQNQLKKDNPDLIFSIRFNQIIGKTTLSLFKNKFVNFHTALLPKYKGLASEFRAFTNNEKYAGFTIHLMVSKLDQGMILHQEKFLLENMNSVYELAIKNHKLGSKKVARVLKEYQAGRIKPVVQKKGGSYGSWPTKSEVAKFRRLNKGYFDVFDLPRLLFIK